MWSDPVYDLSTLFAQLGLDSSEGGMRQFIKAHQIPSGVHMSDADFWTSSQAAFLKEELKLNAKWATVIDELNVLLHEDA